MKTIIYIDGFNLYYRALKDSPYKWLDLKKLAQNLLAAENEIVGIKYFTAKVKPPPNNPKKRLRQEKYLEAIQEYCGAEVILGNFYQNIKEMPLANKTDKSILRKPKVPVIVNEEKGSDVNIATHVLNDAWLNLYDVAVIISNDSDLVGAIKLVHKHTNKKVGVILTNQDTPCYELGKFASFNCLLKEECLKKAQMPKEFKAKSSSKIIKKPYEWD